MRTKSKSRDMMTKKVVGGSSARWALEIVSGVSKGLYIVNLTTMGVLVIGDDHLGIPHDVIRDKYPTLFQPILSVVNAFSDPVDGSYQKFVNLVLASSELTVSIRFERDGTFIVYSPEFKGREEEGVLPGCFLDALGSELKESYEIWSIFLYNSFIDQDCIGSTVDVVEYMNVELSMGKSVDVVVKLTTQSEETYLVSPSLAVP